MHIQYIPTPQTLEAINNGARLMVVKIDEYDVIEFDKEWDSVMFTNKLDNHTSARTIQEFLDDYLPLKQGDEIYIGEDFYTIADSNKVYFADTGYPRCITLKKHEASEMTYEQSRLRFTVGEVSIKSVREFDLDNILSLMICTKYEFEENGWEFVYSKLKEQDIKPTDYVALIEVIEKEK